MERQDRDPRTARLALSEQLEKARAWLRAHASRRNVIAAGTAGVVLIAAVVLLVTGAPPTETANRSPSPSPSAAPATPGVSASAQPTDPGEWTALTLEPHQPVAELVPDAVDGSGISTDASFAFRSLTSTPAVDLAAGLVADPAVELAVSPGPSADVAIVRPADDLAENARYRIELRDPDGALIGEWTFRTGGPLHVVRQLPEDATTQVPLDIGIELEFDQDGVTGVADRFSIEPSVPGDFEVHGRTWVFVPDRALAAATLYTVSLSAGVGIEGSSQVLEEDMQFAFETAGPQSQRSEPRVVFERPVHEIRPSEAAVIPIDVGGDTGEGSVITRRLVVYALPGLDGALGAARTLSVDRGWATWSSNGNVATEGLDEVAAFDVEVSVAWNAQHLSLPTGLPAGWYLLELQQEGRASQVVLQVTDLAAYVLVSETRTIAWVNDLALDAPVPGAVLGITDGSVIARTDSAGLLDVATPDALLGGPDADGALELLLVSAPDGRRVIAPLGGDGYGYWNWYQMASSSEWWLLLGTDRLQYRNDDTIRVWGLIRSRADRSVPGDLELRLVSGYDMQGPPIARVPVTASARGVITGELPVRGLPPGEYNIGLFVGRESVTQASVSITDIRKPTFQVDVSSDRRAYIDGETVTVRAGATFYDGTAAPGLQLRVSASPVTGDGEQVVAVDAAGVAEVTYEASTSGPSVEGGGIYASPAQPEEGTSYGHSSIAVLPSTAWLDADATFGESGVTVTGRVTRVDLAAAEAQVLEHGWVEDPSGDPWAGRKVTVEIDRVTWTEVQIGTTYDFLQKKVVPNYQYEHSVESVGTFTPSSGADGSFLLEVPAEMSNGGIQLTLSTVDDAGRRIEISRWAASPVGDSRPSTFPYLEQRAACGFSTSLLASLGESVSVTMRSGEGAPSAEGRTLFVVGQLGVDEVMVTTGADITRAFDEDAVPSLTVRAVRLSPAGYIVTNDVTVRVDADDKAIAVALEADRERYRPGDEVTLSITTTRSDGTPIAAEVIVQAIDLKLFAIGAAQEVDTSGLMRPVPSGFLRSYASHRVPPPNFGDGCGATTGGDEIRDDFQDLATFQTVTTDAQGRASATFEVPDDLTSWAVSATAVGDLLESGTGVLEVPVGLPFFVDAIMAPEYLAGEEPVVLLRAYGDALADGDAVRFTIDAPALGADGLAVEGRAFATVRVPLPALSLGEHEVTITAERTGPGPELSDGVLRVLRVVPTRLRALETAYDLVPTTFEPPGGDGMTTYVVTDGGRGALIPVLHDLAWTSSARFDSSLAADMARTILIDEFALPDADLPPSGFAGMHGHPPEGFALLPYASADLFLTARTALVAPDRVPVDFVRSALRTEADETSSRERRIVALAGLAGIGDDVLDELRATEVDDLTLRERAWLALGYQAVGDQAAAREIERAILTDHGQRLGPWVRLDAGTITPESAEVTASMLLLAAELRDPIAADIARYLIDNPSSEYLPVLEQIGFVRSAIEWLPRQEARFAWTVDGERHEETIEGGQPFTLRLTADQRRSFILERLDGEVMVASSWAREAVAADLPDDPSVTIERTVSPAGHAPADDFVRVTLNVSFGTGAPAGCYEVTDLVPSGLAPVITPIGQWWDGGGGDRVIGPYAVEGQHVSWCVDPEMDAPIRLGYSARVVTPGTYTWEPAVIQSVAAPSVGSSTPVISYTID
ncbi:MAG TPA: Ig-like domain-containing protein [Patescibacteria group bacterium]|nr:Ig-like domain-containing protein [Patescibacteria group bacterium]